MLSLSIAEAAGGAGLHGFKGDVGRARSLRFRLAGFFMRVDGIGWRRERAALAEHGELLRHDAGELCEQVELPRDDLLPRVSLQVHACLDRG